MEKGKYFRLKAEKEAAMNFTSGTIRLVIIGLSTFFGIVYFVLFISPIVTGRMEIMPTEISIEQIETKGFPDAEYLTIKDAYPVFSEADIQVKNKGTEINFLIVPVVSSFLLEKWEVEKKHTKPIDASRFRLFVIFNGEQVARLWPNANFFDDEDKNRKQWAEGMVITGDTGPARSWIFRPMESNFPKKNLDWGKVRFLKFQKHAHGLWQTIKHFLYATILLILSLYVLKFHLKKRHAPIPGGVPDPWIAQEVLFPHDNTDSDFDID